MTGLALTLRGCSFLFSVLFYHIQLKDAQGRARWMFAW
jgi:hypothetical protein